LEFLRGDVAHYWQQVELRGAAILRRAIVLTLIAGLASQAASAQTRAQELASVTSPDRVFQVRYPKSLLVCAHRDGENPDVWSPEACAADIPVCDNSGHAGNVILCLAYPTDAFHGSELQAAAFSVSSIDNYASAKECAQKWPRSNTSDIHSEDVGGLHFQAAKAAETGNGHVAEQSIYRIFHKGTCYEVDVNLTVALDSAFAAEDKPRKLTPAERQTIQQTLIKAVSGFRFLK
jgi:hypothetical protein